MDKERAADILEEMGQDEDVDILSEMTEEMMHTHIISVDAEEVVKQVRRLFTKYSLLALPVVDEAGKLAGIITVDDVLSLPVNTRGLKM